MCSGCKRMQFTKSCGLSLPEQILCTDVNSGNLLKIKHQKRIISFNYINFV